MFIDCGAYIGDTLSSFLKKSKTYKSIVAFEPAQKNYSVLKKTYGYKNNITLINKGVSDRNGSFLFNEQDAGSKIVDNKEESTRVIPVVSIDITQECKDATFIKMDIEGAEMSALHGAERTIIRNRPKLAICIYHSNEDMLRIIEYIHELVPEYKLYVRHYTSYQTETVLYAII